MDYALPSLIEISRPLVDEANQLNGRIIMNLRNSKLIACLAGLGLCTVAISAANAWYGGPYRSYHGEYGPNAMKQDRQKLMRNHGHAMDDLESIIDGRKRFDRLEATKLAREIEAGAGENMWRLYEPSSVTARGSRTAAPIWGNFEVFKANANALKQTAGALADDALLELTRAGWRNPAGVARSTLQRVAYRLELNLPAGEPVGQRVAVTVRDDFRPRSSTAVAALGIGNPAAAAPDSR